MATLPQQVRSQIEEAERIAKEIYQAPEAEPENTPDPKAAVEEAPAPDAAQQFEAETPQVEEVQDQEGEPAAEETPKAQAPEPAKDTEQEDPNSETYEQRWRTLKGILEAERNKNNELMDRIVGMETTMIRLQELRQSAPPEVPEAPVVEAPRSTLTKEEIEEYGSDFIDVMERAARNAVKDEITALHEENAKLKQALGGVGQKLDASDKDQFYTSLSGAVSNWETVNKDPQFREWLQEDDVFAGETRQALLMRAFEAKDAMRVARFFEGFLNETAAVAEVVTPEQPIPQAKKPSGGKVPLDTLAAPGVGSSGSADNTSQSSGRMFKESDIASFYEDSRKGKFKGRDADYRKTEQQIQAAIAQGNILLGQ